jgi:NAD(P)H-nitrite reductase large subunit
MLKMDIIHAIVNGANSVEKVKRKTYATMWVGCCMQQVEQLIACMCFSGVNT